MELNKRPKPNTENVLLISYKVPGKWEDFVLAEGFDEIGELLGLKEPSFGAIRDYLEGAGREDVLKYGNGYPYGNVEFVQLTFCDIGEGRTPLDSRPVVQSKKYEL